MGAFTAFLIWQSSSKNCVYGGIAMHLWKERLRGELNLCPQISEREESRLKSPHVMRFYPPVLSDDCISVSQMQLLKAIVICHVPRSCGLTERLLCCFYVDHYVTVLN